MNTRQLEKLRRRAIKAGVRRSRKLHHALSREEILALRVQILPALPRLLIIGGGIALVTGAWLNWPSDAAVIRGIEGFCGILLFLFGVFGIRRTLEGIAETAGHGILDTIIDGISSAIDL